MITNRTTKKNRVAIVDKDKCKPNKCQLQCKRICPVERQGKECINVGKTSKTARIVESACLGEGLCVKACPFKAITIVNIPDEIGNSVIHRFGENGFRLYKIPLLRAGQIMGIMGQNGVGKCLAPNTPVLLYNGLIKKAKEINTNDILMGDDSNPRKVLSLTSGEDDMYEIYQSNGDKYVVNGHHVLTLQPKTPEIIHKSKSYYIDYVNNNFVITKKFANPADAKLYFKQLNNKPIDISVYDYLQTTKKYKKMVYGYRVAIDFKNSSALKNNRLNLINSLANTKISNMLMPDIEYLCFSLGFKARFTDDRILKIDKNPLSEINIKYIGKGKYNGFEISDNGRFLLGDFTVTHNSSIVKLLGNKIKPNFENFKQEKTEKEIIRMFRGNEIQKYLELLYANELKISMKPQHIDQIITVLRKNNMDITVTEFIKTNQPNDMTNDRVKTIIEDMELNKIMDSKVQTLSGGELQRLANTVCLLKESDVYIFDEPTNYLDVKQRLKVAIRIRELIKPNKYIIVIEHDLSILDYISDTICIIYGNPGAYGVVSIPYTTAEAINIYFDGYIPAENIRFREEEYSLKDLKTIDEEIEITNDTLTYEGGTIEYPKFRLIIDDGFFKLHSSITLVLGENGVGKCLHPNTPILLYNGRIKKAKDITKNDVLMGDDSTPRKILSLTSGEDEMYMVTQLFGKKYIVNSSHILTILPAMPILKSGTGQYEVTYVDGNKIKKEYFENIDSANTFIKTIPGEPIDISIKDYMEATNEYKEMVGAYHVGVNFNSSKKLPIDPYLFGKQLHYIPLVYKTALWNDRIKLLSGIIDSKNYGTHDEIKIPKKNKLLTKDIEYLCSSLGLLTITTKNMIIIKKNNIINKLTIKPIGKGIYNGFEITGNGRFLLGDFTVTHNSTFLNHLFNKVQVSVSYKPQYLSCEQFKNKDDSYPTVTEFFLENIKSSYVSQLFKSDVITPLNISKIEDRHLDELSGGELQKVWIIYCLGKDAMIYLIDEPSACLDVEQRVTITKILKRYIIHNKKTAFIVEHDMMMAVSLAQELNSQVIVLEKEHSDDDTRISKISRPKSFMEGINIFLKSMDITFRTESKLAKHNRPRINKHNSSKDREQKRFGKYYQ